MQLHAMLLVACLTTVPAVAANGPVPYCDIDTTTLSGASCSFSLAEPLDHDEQQGCPGANVSVNRDNLPDVPSTVRLDPRIECIGP